MNAITKSAILALSLTSAILYAEETEDMIATSRPYRLPRLLTLQTAEVLESYSIGFAGSGNIHGALKGSEDALNGAIYAGLGDVAELGYEMEAVHMAGEDPAKRMRGHIKIQGIKEGNYTPAIAITYGQSLSKGLESYENIRFGLDRQSWILGASKSFSIGKYSVSMHPGFTLSQDELTSIGDSALRKNSVKEASMGAQLGVTWQTTETTMFLFETRTLDILQTSQLGTGELLYTPGVENNLGVRFYLRNWLFLDAGIRSIYDMEKDVNETGIHANFTGLIPINSLADRIWGRSN